jgi:hypothetical protein
MMTALRSERELLVERAAVAAASAWTASYFAALARERRAVSGGWPGTLSEARIRASAEVARELAVQSMAALTHEELAHAARLTNAEARRAWHKNRVADCETG